MSIWHLPPGGYYHCPPVGRRWVPYYRRHGDDWRTHAVGACIGFFPWIEEDLGVTGKWEATQREFGSAMQLAPERWELPALQALTMLSKYPPVDLDETDETDWKREQFANDGRLAEMVALSRRARELAPKARHPVLLEAYALLYMRQDVKAYSLLAEASKKNSVIHPMDAMEEAYEELMIAMGIPTKEAEHMGSEMSHRIPNACNQLRHELARRARKAVLLEEHEKALKLIRYSLSAGEVKPESDDFLSRPLYDVIRAVFEGLIEDRSDSPDLGADQDSSAASTGSTWIENATGYLKEHEAEDLAHALTVEIRSLERERRSRRAQLNASGQSQFNYWTVLGYSLVLNVLYRFISHPAFSVLRPFCRFDVLFSASVVLAHLGILSFIFMLRPNRMDRLRSPERFTVHLLALAMLWLIGLVGWLAALMYATTIHFFEISPNWSPMCLAPLALAALFGLVISWRRKTSIRSNTKRLWSAFADRISPTGILYLGYGYLILVWLAR